MFHWYTKEEYMKRIENSRMARKLILLLVLSLLRPTTSVSGEGPITLRWGSHAVAMEAARGKHLTTTQLGQVMKRHHVTTAWATDMEVCNLPRWTWEDGSDHTKEITTNGFYRIDDQLCGTVKPSIGIDDHACFEHLDYICSFPDLSRTDPNGTCISKYERSFCLYKDRCNYFSARDKCRDKGGILAILPGTQSADKQVSSLTDDIFPKYDQDERAWIGTRKVDICAVLDDGSVTFARHIRWPPYQLPLLGLEVGQPSNADDDRKLLRGPCVFSGERRYDSIHECRVSTGVYSSTERHKQRLCGQGKRRHCLFCYHDDCVYDTMMKNKT